MCIWIPALLGYEREFNQRRQVFTGWYRCTNGWLRDGRWPEWNDQTGERRYDYHTVK